VDRRCLLSSHLMSVNAFLTNSVSHIKCHGLYILVRRILSFLSQHCIILIPCEFQKRHENKLLKCTMILSTGVYLKVEISFCACRFEHSIPHIRPQRRRNNNV
jgi:hypothetical protein